MKLEDRLLGGRTGKHRQTSTGPPESSSPAFRKRAARRGSECVWLAHEKAIQFKHASRGNPAFRQGIGADAAQNKSCRYGRFLCAGRPACTAGVPVAETGRWTETPSASRCCAPSAVKERTGGAAGICSTASSLRVRRRRTPASDPAAPPARGSTHARNPGPHATTPAGARRCHRRGRRASRRAAATGRSRTGHRTPCRRLDPRRGRQ
ncbi:hypothetical protein ebA1364 [Aromatoleum aromaticum EbN1]|uniref:Uncharacterized protein n=1 Tax=Aromatoleum aromaticum (strain DSM 19018 / LMG 30748 / EbN1) TaxID=76114 RepID=Q5P747_AROAE|nr:hypothetical protein ebA1364 [Aromatoleum aromaticum EbN1]